MQKVVQSDNLVSRNGLELTLQNPEGGIWDDEVTYLPGGAIFVSVYDYNQDGHLDLGFSTSMNPYISELWLGDDASYSRFLDGIALGDELLSFEGLNLIKHEHKLNGSDSINSYLWINNNGEFTTIHSWEGLKVKGGNSSPQILKYIKADLDGKIEAIKIKPQVWVAWSFDVLEKGKDAIWLKPDYSGGRFGLGEVVDKMIASYDPKDLTLKSLRQRLIDLKEENGYREKRNVHDSSLKSGLEQKNGELINNQSLFQKSSQEVDRKNNFLWIISSFLLLVVVVIIFRRWIQSRK